MTPSGRLRSPGRWWAGSVLFLAVGIAGVAIGRWVGHGGASGPEAELGVLYRVMVAHHVRVDRRLEPGSILLVGDSHVQGLYAPYVSCRAVNFGIGGDTYRGILARVGRYGALERASALVLCAGTNDLKYRTADETAMFVRELLAAVPATVPVIVVGPPPVDESRLSNRLDGWLSNERIVELNRRLAAACGAVAGCLFLDLSHRLAPGGAVLSSLYEPDGVHLSRGGYQVFEDALRTALRSVLGGGGDVRP